MKRRTVHHLCFLGMALTFVIPLSFVMSEGAQGSHTEEHARSAPLSIDEEPLLVLGEVDADSPELFHRVRVPFMMEGDRVAVPIGGDLQIRIFGLDGQVVRQYGRPGAGPGEFNDLTGAWARGDTIEAFDRALNRITRFHRGSLIGTVPLQGQNLPILAGRPGPLGDGWAFVGVVAVGVAGWDELRVFRFDRDGSGTQLAPAIRGFQRYESPQMMGLTPLTPRAQVVSHGETLFVGETLTPEISVLDASGEPVRKVRWDPGTIPDPVEAVGVVSEMAIARAPADQRAFLQAHFSHAPDPEMTPVFSSFLVDDAGFIWVRPFRVERDAEPLGGPFSPGATGPGGRWILFTPDGERIGEIAVPDTLELQDIGLDFVVGIRKDRLGIEYVQVHRLQREVPS